MTRITKIAAAGLMAMGMGLSVPAHADELSLAYFMGPKHPMNGGLITPFGEKLAELSGGELTVKNFPGGALNGVPPAQYSILLDGVADIVFAIPGYTADVFPMTSVVGLPGVCDSALGCTEALLRVRGLLETEYQAKVLAMWGNAPPVLLTRDKPVTTLDDLQGMTVRVTSKGDVPFVESLGATAVTQPVNVINQNLANGVIDAIMIDPSAIRSFKLHEPANYATSSFPGSGSAFVLLMNQDVYDDLSDEMKAAVDAASDAALSLQAGTVYDKVANAGLQVALDNGVEVVEWADGERAKIDALVEARMVELRKETVGTSTVGELIKMMRGE
jgi:TRAP-type C4-dicarboxylate transport system substrate-binding protein